MTSLILETSFGAWYLLNSLRGWDRGCFEFLWGSASAMALDLGLDLGSKDWNVIFYIWNLCKYYQLGKMCEISFIANWDKRFTYRKQVVQNTALPRELCWQNRNSSWGWNDYLWFQFLSLKTYYNQYMLQIRMDTLKVCLKIFGGPYWNSFDGFSLLFGEDLRPKNDESTELTQLA